MSTVLGISDAASLALHTMVLLAVQEGQGRPLSVKRAAKELSASEAHLSKVLQRLAKAGFVRSSRGPAGGYALARPAGRIRLLDVYETIEGKLDRQTCLLGVRACGGRKCILGKLLNTLNDQVRDYLGKTNLTAVADVYSSPA